ncbi:MAG: hypothetical protein ACK4S3_07675 [Parvibaculum sp.]
MSVICEAPAEAELQTICVGQDRAGHWLVQARGGSLEGRFISFAAAMSFARSELGLLSASRIEVRNTPMEATTSFAPLQPWEQAVPEPANCDALSFRKSA